MNECAALWRILPEEKEFSDGLKVDDEDT